LNAIVQWAELRLQEIRKHDGGGICVLCSQLATGELRGLSPSLWLDQRTLRNATALKEMPICRAPFPETDSNFPALDWSRWICRRFTNKVPQLFGWWKSRLALCRIAGLPVCNAPETVPATVPAALDVLYARQLQQDSQIRWSSTTSRPDLGETTLALVDAQEESVEAVNWVLQGKDLSEGRGGGQINKPGVYRSICMEVNLRTKICVCALQHARYLSDMEGGELSRKMIRKVGPDMGNRNLDHSSEASVTSLESLVTMVQEIASGRDAKEAEIISLRQAWASQSDAGKEALKKAGIRADTASDNDEDFVNVLISAGCEDSRMATKLEELRTDFVAQSSLLDGLYGWLASPSSLLYDPALLRRVHQYMDKVLKLLMDVMKRNGCTVIHASYSQVLFETGKLRVIPDMTIFWEALRDSIQTVKALEPLALDDVTSIGNMFYGMIWLDPSDFAGVPIDMSTGEVEWKVHSSWKLAEFLPPAVRPSLLLYAGELLLGPQKELGRRFGTSENSKLPAEDLKAAADMEVDRDPDMADCRMDDEDDEAEVCGADRDQDMDVDGEAAGEASTAAAAAAAAAKTEEADAGADGKQVAKAIEEIGEYLKHAFFEELRRRVLRYVDELQVQQQQEQAMTPTALANMTIADPEGSDNSEDEDIEDEDERRQAQEERRRARLKKHVEQKWSFPEVPGRKSPPGAADVEFMRALVQIFSLDETISEQVQALRDRMCQKVKVSAFQHGLDFESTCMPLVLKDVSCPWCCVASHVDITSHPHRGPGLWVCKNCERTYDKDAMQARLVDLLHSIVQAWQSQELVCKKCRGLRTAKMQNFCECFGRYQVRFSLSDFRLVLKVLGSLTGPHDLPWLREMIELHQLSVS